MPIYPAPKARVISLPCLWTVQVVLSLVTLTGCRLPKSGGTANRALQHSGGESFQHVIMAQDESKFLVGSDAGYGFVGTFKDMVSKNKRVKPTYHCLLRRKS